MKSVIAWITLFFVVTCLASEQKPNIIFILADDWGIGDVKTYGGDRCKLDTPNMDQLAEQGITFMDAHSSSSVCTPTRYSVLTGRYNWRSQLKSGVLMGFSTALIEPGRATVASFLKENGYITACFGKWHLGMDFPTTDGKPANSAAKNAEELKTKCNVDWDGKIENSPNTVGFDYYWGISASLDMPPYIWIENDRFVGECTAIKTFIRAGPAQADFHDDDVLPTLSKKAVEFVTAHARMPEPFFLYVALNSPHTPISPSKAFQGKSPRGAYGDFVMETDWAIGQIVKAIDKAGIAENTLIIVTSDNGCSPAAMGKIKGLTFNMGEENPVDPDAHYACYLYRGHKADIYEGGHRVPYIARWTGKIKAGSLCADPVCLVDLFATCADILEKKLPDTCAEDSVSLLPNLLGNAKGPVREAVIHHSINGSFAIRQGQWKLNFCPGSGGWSTPKPSTNKKGRGRVIPQKESAEQWVQLYDLSTDCAETKNVAQAHPEIVEHLTQLAEKYIREGRSTPGKRQTNTGETHLYPKWIRTTFAIGL